MTRIDLAIAVELIRLNRADPERVAALGPIYAAPPDSRALAVIDEAVTRGRINGQEGSRLTQMLREYDTQELAVRVVLSQALCELMGLDVSRLKRHHIFS